MSSTMIGIDDNQRQNLETLANISAQATSLPNDEVQDVLDCCILESTKTKHVNQAILYFKFAFDCFCSEDKKHLNGDFSIQSLLINFEKPLGRILKLLIQRGQEEGLTSGSS